MGRGEARREQGLKETAEKALFGGSESRGPTFPLCNLFATILLLVIFTLICNDRNGARELHSYFVDPSPSSSSSFSSLSSSSSSCFSSRLFSTGSESISGSRTISSLPYAIPSGVGRLYGCWPSCVRFVGGPRGEGEGGGPQWTPYDFGSGVFCQRQTRGCHG